MNLGSAFIRPSALSLESYVHLSMEQREKAYIECFLAFQEQLHAQRSEEPFCATNKENDHKIHILEQLIPRKKVQEIQNRVFYFLKIDPPPIHDHEKMALDLKIKEKDKPDCANTFCGMG